MKYTERRPGAYAKPLFVNTRLEKLARIRTPVPVLAEWTDICDREDSCPACVTNTNPEDYRELERLGIVLCGGGIERDGIEIEYVAEDPAAATAILRERYATLPVAFRCIGASFHTKVPYPLGSWASDGDTLTVFYEAGINGESLGRCTAEEHPDRIVVTLTQLIPPYVTLMAGFIPAHATVELLTAVGERTVIDASDDLPRPRRTGHHPSEVAG